MAEWDHVTDDVSREVLALSLPEMSGNVERIGKAVDYAVNASRVDLTNWRIPRAVSGKRSGHALRARLLFRTGMYMRAVDELKSFWRT